MKKLIAVLIILTNQSFAADIFCQGRNSQLEISQFPNKTAFACFQTFGATEHENSKTCFSVEKAYGGNLLLIDKDGNYGKISFYNSLAHLNYQNSKWNLNCD